MSKPQAATWNRDDRDLLVELRTQMSGVRDEIAAARIEIKEINSGVTNRLLNLESNSINRIEFEEVAKAVDSLKQSRVEYRTQMRNWLAFGALLYGALQLLLAVYFHYH